MCLAFAGGESMKQFCLMLLMLSPQVQEPPLPEPSSFMAEFRKTLHSDGKLLSQYTYTQKVTRITLDSNGKAKKTEINVYQIINGDEDWKTYERQIVKNGIPVSQQELEKKDREEKERVSKETIKIGKQSEAKRQQDKAKADREEQETLDDVFAMYDLQFVRRETLGAIPTILITFKPKPNFKPKTSDGKSLQHIAGRVWIAESDHELARVEAEIIDPLSFGGGLLAKLNKGSTLVFERRKINGEIWLPVKEELNLNARVLLLKGLNVRVILEYSEHKKFGADIQLIFGDGPTGPAPQ